MQRLCVCVCLTSLADTIHPEGSPGSCWGWTPARTNWHNAQIALQQHFKATNSSQHQTHIRTSCKNAQIAPALTNGNIACVHISRLTWSWSSSAHPKYKFPFHQEEMQCLARAKQERKREDPQNKQFWQLLGMSPKPPTWVQSATSLRPIHYHGHSSPLENPGQPSTMKAQDPAVASGNQQQPAPRWAPKSVTKRVCGGGPAAHLSKVNKQARLMGRKVCFILDASNWGVRRWTRVQRPALPTNSNQWVRASIDRKRGLHAETAQSALSSSNWSLVV